MFAQIEKMIKEEEAFTERLKALSLRINTLVENQKAINLARLQEIKDLERQINDTIFDQKRVESLPFKGFRGFHLGAVVSDTPSRCLWENIPLSERHKPMGMVCSCIKCSTMCVTYSDSKFS